MANTSSTHPPTHRRRRPGCRCLTGRCAPNHDKVNAPFLPVPLAMNGRSVLHSNKESRICDAVFAIILGGFSRIKNSSPNWDANSWQDVISVDTNSLRHLPRRSSKNYDLQFANFDRQTEYTPSDYSTEMGQMYCLNFRQYSAKFSMQPKADMVPKECGFNQSETASGLCARIVTFSMLACNGKGWRRTYTNAVFLSSCRHNLPPKLKLRNNQTIRNVGMWM